jgi:predicted nucleotidyltransferase
LPSFPVAFNQDVSYIDLTMFYSINTVINPYEHMLAELCEQYRIAKLYVFGSVVNGKFDKTTSDIDFLAQFKEREPTPDYADRFMGFERALQTLLNRPVDLLTVEGLKRPGLRKTVEQTRQLIYESNSEK